MPFFSLISLFLISFRRWGRGRAGAGQGAHPTNRREDHGQVQSQGGGDATALFCSWRGTFVNVYVKGFTQKWKIIFATSCHFKSEWLSFCCREYFKEFVGQFWQYNESDWCCQALKWTHVTSEDLNYELNYHMDYFYDPFVSFLKLESSSNHSL